MKVSIITPSFNQGRFIEETIQSIISQKGDFELEYIIIDGGSTDNTLKIIKKYDLLINHSKKFKPSCKKLFFRWISEKDSGQSQAINKGFRMARGEVVNWICSDDLLEENALQKVAEFFKSNLEAKIVTGNSKRIGENGRILRFVYSKEFSHKELVMFWERHFALNEIAQPSLFFKGELLDELGYLNEDSHFAMDYEWWLKASKKYRFFYINEFLSKGRFYPECKSIKHEKETLNTIYYLSRKYWKENILKYYWAYCFYLSTQPIFLLSLKLKQKSKGYEWLVGKIKEVARLR